MLLYSSLSLVLVLQCRLHGEEIPLFALSFIPLDGGNQVMYLRMNPRQLMHDSLAFYLQVSPWTTSAATGDEH